MKLRSRDAFPAESSAAGSTDKVHVEVLRALQAEQLGISFSGAGFGAAYQLGAAYMLQELGVLNQHTPVAGTSAGSIVAVAICCSIPYLAVLSELKSICNDLLQHGFRKRLRSVLQPALERLLPDDAHEHCNARCGFALAATRIQGPCPVCWKGELMQEPFSSKEDLVQRILTAVHEPLQSDGRLCAPYRRHLYADGGMQLPVPPVPGAAYSIIIYPVCNRLLTRRWPYKLLMHPPLPTAVAISPGQYWPWPLSNSYKKSNHLVMHPQPPEVLGMLFERGRRDALRWAQHIRLPVISDEPQTPSQDMTAAAAPATKKDVLQDEKSVQLHQEEQVRAAVNGGSATSREKVMSGGKSSVGGSTTHIQLSANNPSAALSNGSERQHDANKQQIMTSPSWHDTSDSSEALVVRRQHLLSQDAANLPTVIYVSQELLHWL